MLPVHVCFKFDSSIADSNMVIFYMFHENTQAVEEKKIESPQTAVFLSIANYGKIFNKNLYFLGHKSQSTMRQLYRKWASTCSILMELLLFHAHVISRKSCLCSADLASVHNNWQCVVTLQGPFVKNKVVWIWSSVKVTLCCILKGGRGN